MKEPSGPVEFDPAQWAKFDFSHWHLDGLPLADPEASLAGLAQALFASPEWQQRLTGKLPALRAAVQGHFTEQARELEARLAGLEKTLAERTAAVREEITALQTRERQVSAPPA